MGLFLELMLTVHINILPVTILVEVWQIIKSGNNVGNYDDRSTFHGFVYDGSTYTTIDYPGASRTHVYGINGSNKIEE